MNGILCTTGNRALKALEIPQRLAVVLLLALGAAIFFATYRAIDSVVEEQSRVQQQAITPVHDLVQATGRGNSIALGPEPGLVTTSTVDCRVEVWEAATGRRVGSLT